jgi:hypothetical protein
MEWIVLCTIACLVAVAFCSPLFPTWSNWGIADWDQHLTYHAVPYISVVEYRQFPLWNPYMCGGMVMHANPQARVLSVFFPLHLLFGFLAGVKLELVIHVAIGLVGSYALARDVLRSRIGAAVSAITFMLSGMYAQSVAVGMTWFMSVAYVPWSVFGFLRSATKPSYLWLMGAALALVFFNGGAYVVVIALFGLSVYALADALERRTWSPVVRLALGSGLMLGLGAVKFLPSIAFMHSFPRKIDDYSGYSVASLLGSLFNRHYADSLAAGRDAPGFLRGVSWGPDENCMYVGPLAGVLFALGLLKEHARRVPWLALVFVTLLISFGNRAHPSPWALLHRLPIFDSMRVAQRFRIAMMLGASVFCGLGAMTIVDAVAARYDASRARLIGWALALFLALDLFTASSPVFSNAFVLPPQMTGWPPQRFRQTKGDPNSMLAASLRNLGTIECYETAAVPQNAIPEDYEGYRGEAFLDGTDGKVDIVEWSPNRLELDVMATGPGQVVVNQHAYPGWRVEQGNAVLSVACKRRSCRPQKDGIIAIPVAAGRRRLDVYYRPESFVYGSFVTFVFLLALAGSFRPPGSVRNRFAWLRNLVVERMTD